MALHDLPSNKPLSTTGGSFFALIFLLVHHSNLRVFVTVSSFYGPTWLLFSFPNAGVMYKFNLLSYSHSNLPYKTPCRYFYDFFAYFFLLTIFFVGGKFSCSEFSKLIKNYTKIGIKTFEHATTTFLNNFCPFERGSYSFFSCGGAL